MRARSRTRALSSRREGDAERLLAHFFASNEKHSNSHLIQLACREMRAILRCDDAEYWELETPGEVVLRHREGRPQRQEEVRRASLNENPVFSRALADFQAVVATRKELEAVVTGSECRDQACLAVPVRPRRGPEGVLVFTRGAKRITFNEGEVTWAQAIAAALGTVLCSVSNSQEGMQNEANARKAATVASDLKPSLLLPEFVRDFTVRAAAMLGARLAFLALSRGARLETVFAQEFDYPSDPAARSEIDVALTILASERTDEIVAGSVMKLIGMPLASSLNWRHLCLVRLVGREGGLLGILCLVDRDPVLTASDRNLIHAVAGHASVALENSRLFSRIEQSKRQWVEDFDAIHDLIVVHDPANRILRINRSLAQMLGAQPSELVGANMSVVGEFAKSGSGNGCPFCSDPETRSENSILNAGMRSYLVSTSRIGAGGEESSRTIHVLKDITEQRSYQSQLKRERDFNTNILNHTQNMILVLDTAGLISYANRRCYEAGFREKELLGHQLTQFVRRDQRPLLEKAFLSMLQGSAAENLELAFLFSNRSTGQFSVNMSPMRSESGEVNSVVVVMTDITDARVLQAQLRHSEKMAALGQLVSGVAHEINNPLASIIGYSDLLLENPGMPEGAKEELNIVMKEAERTKEIVQNLLRFARQMPSRRERLDVQAILQQVMQLRTYGAANEGVEVVERGSSRVAPIHGDADQLQQVFLNILNNAYDAVRDQRRAGRIEISAANRDGFVEIAIRDNGTGVSDTERIFEPFYTTKEVGKGTGLGLSICYGIVREHGGEISCANNGDGPGCTIYVRLPVASDAVKASVAEAV